MVLSVSSNITDPTVEEGVPEAIVCGRTVWRQGRASPGTNFNQNQNRTSVVSYCNRTLGVRP